MTGVQIHKTLRRLFDAVVREAEQNPGLAEKLAQAIGEDLGARPRAPRPASRRAFDASQLHAINILRLHGEAALRGKLEQVKAVEDLKAVAKSSGLVLSGSAAKTRPLRSQLITGIIEAAKHYDAQRGAAAV
jgi:hypothetical protein